MTKWEYLTAKASYFESEKKWQIFSENGKEVRPCILVYEYFNRVGELGWELVSELQNESKTNEYMWTETGNLRNYKDQTLDMLKQGYDLVNISMNDNMKIVIFQKTTIEDIRTFRFKRPKE